MSAAERRRIMDHIIGLMAATVRRRGEAR